jgi:uncharacterized phage protein (TIGR02218 family)
MKNISGPLQALFDTKQFNMCGLYQFDLLNGGGSLYYCSGDADQLWSAQNYSSGGTVGPFLERGQNKAKMHQKIGLEVDTLIFDTIPGASLIDGVPFLVAARQGVFDGATLTYSGSYWPQQAYTPLVQPTGIVIKFVGRVAEVDISKSLVTFTINSHLELLNMNMPRNLWQSGCVNTLYDASCALNQASFGTAGTVASPLGANGASFNTTLAQADHYFDLGVVTFTSGANGGISRTVKSYFNGSPGSVFLISPFPNTAQIGDTFTIYPGCDKAQATCIFKFNNLANFRGFPFVPINETAV